MVMAFVFGLGLGLDLGLGLGLRAFLSSLSLSVSLSSPHVRLHVRRLCFTWKVLHGPGQDGPGENGIFCKASSRVGFLFPFTLPIAVL